MQREKTTKRKQPQKEKQNYGEEREWQAKKHKTTTHTLNYYTAFKHNKYKGSK